MKPPKPISPFRLLSLLRLQKDPTSALQLFRDPNPDTTPKKPFRYSLSSYDLIITKLGRAKMFDEMEQILNQLKQEKRFVPGEIIFCNVISSYGRAKQPDRAIQTFDRMPSFRCERTVKSANSLLDALFKCGEFEKMRELFLAIDRYGTPDACTYNILINFCCKSGNLDDARNVFEEMQTRGASPNVVTFGTLIHHLCLNSRLKEAFKLKEEMVSVYCIEPNAYMYASLVRGLCGSGEVNSAFRLKEEMARNALKMDSAVFSTLIRALFKDGRKEEAFGVLEEMKEIGCKPDTVTYNAIIHGFCNENDSEAAFRILDEMVEKGCKPDVISYNVIIGGLCKEGKWSEARDLFEDLPRRGCPPDVVSYRTLLDGLIGWKQFEAAAFILDEMIFKGFAPRRVGVNELVDGLCHQDNLELLGAVLSSLGKANLIDEDVWRMVILKVYKMGELLNSSVVVDSLMMP